MNDINIFQAFIMFQLHSRMDQNEFEALKSDFMNLLDENEPEKALTLINTTISAYRL